MASAWRSEVCGFDISSDFDVAFECWWSEVVLTPCPLILLMGDVLFLPSPRRRTSRPPACPPARSFILLMRASYEACIVLIYLTPLYSLLLFTRPLVLLCLLLYCSFALSHAAFFHSGKVTSSSDKNIFLGHTLGPLDFIWRPSNNIYSQIP